MPAVLDLDPAVRTDAEILWRFHRLDHEMRPASAAMGLGSHDPGVPVYAAELYHRDLFPYVVFTGANAPTTVERFPRGEAVHYREIALEHGVPDASILVEPRAKSTEQNVLFSRELLAAQGIAVESLIVICRPYQQRRAYGIVRKLWPEIAVSCTGEQTPLDEYIGKIGDAGRVVNMLVGDTQRLGLDWLQGIAIHQPAPAEVWDAQDRLVTAGYTSHVIEGLPLQPGR